MELETYRFRTTSPKTYHQSVGRSMRHALMAIAFHYRDGQVVTGSAPGVTPQAFIFRDGLAVPYATPVAAPAPKPAPKAIEAQPAVAPAPIAPQPVATAPAAPANDGLGVVGWLQARGYTIKSRRGDTTVMRAPQPAPVAPPAPNPSPQPAPVKRERHPVLTEASRLARMDPDSLAQYIIEHATDVASEMGKPANFNRKAWAERIRGMTPNQLAGVVRSSLKQARSKANEETRKGRADRSYELIRQLVATAQDPQLVTIGQHAPAQAMIVDGATVLAIAKEAPAAAQFVRIIADGTREGVQSVSVKVSALKSLAGLSKSWIHSRFYLSGELGLVVTYQRGAKHGGGRGRLILCTRDAYRVQPSDLVIALPSAVTAVRAA